MSDSEKPAEPAPEELAATAPLTNADLEVLIQFLAGLAMMGMVKAVFHPCRFPLLYDAMLRHGAIVNPEELAERMEEVNIPIVLESPVNGKPIQCDIVQWVACPEGCDGCKAIEAQGANYPRPPEERPQIWTPN